MRDEKIEALAERIPRQKQIIFDSPSTEDVPYSGELLTTFISKMNTSKSLRHILLKSKVGSVFEDLEIGTPLEN